MPKAPLSKGNDRYSTVTSNIQHYLPLRKCGHVIGLLADLRVTVGYIPHRGKSVFTTVLFSEGVNLKLLTASLSCNGPGF